MTSSATKATVATIGGLLGLASVFAVGQDMPLGPNGLPPIPPGKVLQRSLQDLPEEARKALQDISLKPAGFVLENVPLFMVSEREVMCTTTLGSAGVELREPPKTAISVAPLDQLDIAAPRVLLNVRSSTDPSKDTATRVFRVIRSGDHCIEMTEWNFVADGGGIMQLAERINRRVLGQPAVLTIVQAPSGAAEWKMSWQVNGVEIELVITDSKLDLKTENLVMHVAERLTVHYKATLPESK